MKLIRVGLTTNSSLLHEYVYLKDNSNLLVTGFIISKEKIDNNDFHKPIFSHSFTKECFVQVKNQQLTVNSNTQNKDESFFLDNNKQNQSDNLFSLLLIKSSSGKISISKHKNNTLAKYYCGQIIIIADQNKIRIILYSPLEDYVQSVLQGEVPATYHLEAIKAQAVCARTYALNPRVNHTNDFCNVCDSYECCQCFTGIPKNKNTSYEIASIATKGQILTYKDKPILALFSSCAGGHTENYEDCFSDWTTNIFPPPALPYLRGVSEDLNQKISHQKIDEKTLKNLWYSYPASTVDGLSKNFRWSLQLSNDQLESHIHHNISQLIEQKDFAPFITPPSSGIFGEISSFSVIKRGVGGTAIILNIHTSKGDWSFTKELTIRNLFKNSNPNLKRLRSAKIFFDQIKNDKGQLLHLYVYGLGSGHGVGLQQAGSQGLADKKKNYREILAHYYTKINLDNIESP